MMDNVELLALQQQVTDEIYENLEMMMGYCNYLRGGVIFLMMSQVGILIALGIIVWKS